VLAVVGEGIADGRERPSACPVRLDAQSTTSNCEPCAFLPGIELIVQAAERAGPIASAFV